MTLELPRGSDEPAGRPAQLHGSEAGVPELTEDAGGIGAETFPQSATTPARGEEDRPALCRDGVTHPQLHSDVLDDLGARYVERVAGLTRARGRAREHGRPTQGAWPRSRGGQHSRGCDEGQERAAAHLGPLDPRLGRRVEPAGYTVSASPSCLRRAPPSPRNEDPCMQASSRGSSWASRATSPSASRTGA